MSKAPLLKDIWKAYALYDVKRDKEILEVLARVDTSERFFTELFNEFGITFSDAIKIKIQEEVETALKTKAKDTKEKEKEKEEKASE